MKYAYVVTGTLEDSQTIKLDEALSARRGKVRVVIEVIETPPTMSHMEFMEQLRERQRQRGHVPRTREEVDAELREGRGG